MEVNLLHEPLPLAVVALAFAMGGILKGATGAGAPVVAIPIMAAIYDVRVAVALMLIPNFSTNVAQVVKYRANLVEPGFARNFAVTGMIGAGVGSLLLAKLPVSALQLLMAGIIIAYVVLRLARPELMLPVAYARKLVFSAGFFGGILQGSTGISAPIALTFLNSMRLARSTFIYTVSMFFAAMAMMQLPVLLYYDIMTLDIAILGVLALLPMFVAMPIGEWIGQRISPKLFDKGILLFLIFLAVRLIYVELV